MHSRSLYHMDSIFPDLLVVKLQVACPEPATSKCSTLVLSPQTKLTSSSSNSHVPLACSNAQAPLVLSHPAISPGDRSSKPYILPHITSRAPSAVKFALILSSIIMRHASF
ncbi:hypothetical protein J3458_003055 [Metarhizium acridum]|uniref:uncharacterized protein n=1 Tax=Metarhizium acridum TaxID=92637 RepID=UPI001C6B532A|nr:hypothetical protein J3458_003055 [Metarhizium acridum]